MWQQLLSEYSHGRCRVIGSVGLTGGSSHALARAQANPPSAVEDEKKFKDERKDERKVKPDVKLSLAKDRQGILDFGRPRSGRAFRTPAPEHPSARRCKTSFVAGSGRRHRSNQDKRRARKGWGGGVTAQWDRCTHLDESMKSR